MGYQAEHLPYGCDPDVHRRVTLTDEESAAVSFRLSAMWGAEMTRAGVVSSINLQTRTF
jgi:hypothetical protein